MYANTNLMAPRRIWLSLVAAMLLALALAQGQTVLASQHSGDSDCHFALGFKELRNLIPDIVGDCVENEQHDTSAGVTTQRTSRGVMTWNKSDNLTTFTDGVHTWTIGKHGLLQRDGGPHGDLLQLVEESLAAPEAFEGLRAVPLAVPAGDPSLWAVHSSGSRFGLLDAEEPSHFVAIYTREGAEWRELARLDLANEGSDTPEADYLSEESVRQVMVEPSRLWLEVHGGVGAHSGTYQLLSFDGTALRIEVAGFNSFGDLGWVADLNDDGAAEAIVDQSDAYVFCFACGVRTVDLRLYRWDADQQRMLPVALQMIPVLRENPAASVNRAVRLAEHGLWKDALSQISIAGDIAGEAAEPAIRETLEWNRVVIKAHVDAHVRAATEGPFPLLANVFYGDYEAAVELMTGLTAGQIFDLQTPLVAGTVAEGPLPALSDRIIESSTMATEARSGLAAAYFLRGWANYLNDPDGRLALADVSRAADLSPDEALFAHAEAHLFALLGAETAVSPLQGTLLFKRGDGYVSLDLESGETARLFEGAEEMSWTKSGDRVAFTRSEGELSKVYVARRDGSDERPITGVYDSASQPAISPDGKLLALVREPRFESEVEPVGGELWIVDLATLDKTVYVLVAMGFKPAWSPDGSQLAYAIEVESSGNGIAVLYQDEDGIRHRTLVTTETESGTYTPFEWTIANAGWLTDPTWSPDGLEITFRATGGTHGAYLTTDSLDGGITRFLGLSWDHPASGFSYSPDGSLVTLNLGGLSGYDVISVYQLADIGEDGSKVPERIAGLGRMPQGDGEGESVIDFAWSPDGAYLAYVSTPYGAGERQSESDTATLWIVPVGGGVAIEYATDADGPIYWLPE